MGLQSHKSSNLGNFGTPTWSFGTKSHLDVGSMANHRVCYKGEGGGFPQVRAIVNLVCPCCPWFVLAPRVLQLCTNHLVWVLCKPMWVNEACQLFLVPSQNFSTPFYPSKCYEPGSVLQLLLLPLFFTWTHNWIPQGVGSASICVMSQLEKEKVWDVVAPLGQSFLIFLSHSIQPPTPMTFVPREQCHHSHVYSKHNNKEEKEKVATNKRKK